jgi:hypothetical protein
MCIICTRSRSTKLIYKASGGKVKYRCRAYIEARLIKTW